MEHKKIILVSKDAMGKFYLPTYGNKYWKTPNIDELAAKGTVFNRHYASSPSSAMSWFGMFTGLYAMETKIQTYRRLSEDEIFRGETLFHKAEKLGYECHIIWDKSLVKSAKSYTECYSEDTVFHLLDNIKQPTGVHAVTGKKIVANPQVEKETCEKLENCIKEIAILPQNTFTWIHLPHVFNGRTGYGTDIDLFDWFIGMVREHYDDDCIFITADHGNMNGAHGKLAYGFDVYEQATAIPLITPRLENSEVIDYPTCNIDLYNIIFEREIPKREFVYVDSAYYAQLHRKLAIIHNNYKFIYSNEGKKKELYDVVFDPYETRNLLEKDLYDVDRGIFSHVEEMYFYPEWDNVDAETELLEKEWQRVWKKMSPKQYCRAVYEKIGKRVKRKLLYKKRMREKLQGR